MINILSENLNRVIKLFPDVFSVLEKAAELSNTRFYLIGGQLRDVWISHANLRARVTEDIDFSVLLEKDFSWDELAEILIKESGLTRDSARPYRFFLNRQQIDLIPFGYLEKENEIEILPPRMVISVDGFNLVKDRYHLISEKYRVLHLEAYLFLKLISWSEKMYERAKDLDDFTLIVKYLQDINPDIIFEDLFRELLFNVENEFIHARIIASWIKPVIDGDKRLITKIENAISKFIGKASADDIDYQYAEYKAGNTHGDDPLRKKIMLELLTELKSG